MDGYDAGADSLGSWEVWCAARRLRLLLAETIAEAQRAFDLALAGMRVAELSDRAARLSETRR